MQREIINITLNFYNQMISIYHINTFAIALVLTTFPFSCSKTSLKFPSVIPSFDERMSGSGQDSSFKMAETSLTARPMVVTISL